ncbi:hypothetical protein [Streptoalloteichus hindustanus]|uniref:Uncharacterized protein n=1 Tax=Streptoalloteichus hindustanus TaxID=2017 RepID=A0A1M5QFT9_STRHI|nr:hypothetical protein [Streptoalloteichus hindustanus]SHH12720.1 hypothetical protein SAMN05444320_1246 [Streptoalloteichus hindustanus]
MSVVFLAKHARRRRQVVAWQNAAHRMHLAHFHLRQALTALGEAEVGPEAPVWERLHRAASLAHTLELEWRWAALGRRRPQRERG